MALNNTGALSLGGSTAGESINLEMGLSATAQISLNDTVIRGLAGVTSGQISISNFYGKSNVSYFTAMQYNASSTGQGGWAANGVTIDSNRNIYTTTSNSSTVRVIKYDAGGTILWQRLVAVGANSNTSMFCDSSNNIYFMAGSTTMVKYNTAGVLQWAIGFPSQVYQAKYSSSDNTVVALHVGGNPYQTTVTKVDGNGSQVWSRCLGYSGGYNYFNEHNTGQGLAIDTSGNIYLNGGVPFTLTANNRLFLVNRGGSSWYEVSNSVIP
jgi:hypothetical protein